MAKFGGFYKGEKKKQKKERLEKQAANIKHISSMPHVEIIGKGKSKGK